MKQGALVTYGWKYRRKSIVSIGAPLGIVLTLIPEIKWATIDKLRFIKGTPDRHLHEDFTEVVDVYWEDGLVQEEPVCNLIEVKNNE